MSGAQDRISADVVSRFLPGTDPAAGPASLLGLHADHTHLNHTDIASALLAQLARIDDHPQARTPEADELRVALHVAAAQLRHVATVSHTAPESAVMPQTSADPVLEAPGAMEVGLQAIPKPLAAPQDEYSRTPGDDFVIAVRHVLATSGGWNAESKLRLGYLSRSMGLHASLLQSALVRITQEHQRPIAGEPSAALYSGANPTATIDRFGEVHGPGLLTRSATAGRPLDAVPANVSTRRWMSILTLILFLSSGALLVVLGTIIAGRMDRSVEVSVIGDGHSRVAIAGPAGVRTPRDGSGEHSADAVGSSHPHTSGRDAEVLIRLLNQLDKEAIENAPEEAKEHFVSAFQQLAIEWVTSGRDTTATAAFALRDVVLAASEYDLRFGVELAQIAAGPLEILDGPDRVLRTDQVSASVFSFVVSGMLLGTPLNPPTERALRSRLNSIASSVDRTTADSSFNALLYTALIAQAELLRPRASDNDSARFEAVWQHWTRLADAGFADANAILLDAVSRLVALGENPGSHRPTGAVLNVLIRAISWSQPSDEIARRRLLEWFDDANRVSTTTLSLITASLIDSGAIPGLGVNMRLSSGASDSERRSLRDLYALRLGLPQIGDGRLFFARWNGFADELLDTSVPSGYEGALSLAIRAAWINESMLLWMSGDERGAELALERVQSQTLAGLASGRPRPVLFGARSTPRADGEWAARYLRARRSTDDRMRLLYEFGNSGGPGGQADADVITEAAMYSTPLEVRRLAQRMVNDYADRPEIVLGLLEVLPRAARHDGVSTMIEQVTGRSLPAPSSQNWRLEARRALVARALEVLASDESVLLDLASELYSDSLTTQLQALQDLHGVRQAAADDPFPLGLPGPRTPGLNRSGDPMVPLMNIVDLLSVQAERYPERARLFASLDELRARRAWRVRLASTHTAGFASELASRLEFSAYALGCERPLLASEIHDLIASAATGRRDSPTVYHQMLASETALIRLHRLRTERGVSP